MQIIPEGHQFGFAAEDIWQVSISPDYTASAVFCAGGDLKQCSKDTVKGKWQTYYDQALRVKLENDLRFVANFKYELKSNVTS